MAEEHKKHPLFDKSHKIGILAFLLFFVLGIPLTVVASKNSPYLNSINAEIAGNTLQMEAFNPTLNGQRASLPHVDGQAIVRYNESVSIKTKTGVNQTETFTPDDITGGLPSEYVQGLKSIPVSSIKRIGPGVVSGAAEANKYVANIYLVSFPPSSDLTKVLDSLCDNSTITMYCEPNYKFTLIPASGNIIGAQTQQSSEKNLTFGLVNAPLPPGYTQEASSLDLPAISQNQIMPNAEQSPQVNSNALSTAFYIHSALPDSKFLYAGACGENCSLSSIVDGIIFTVNKGANMIYLSEQAAFPVGIEPYSLESAIYYALSKKVGVIAATGSIDEQETSQNFIKSILSFVIGSAYANGNCENPKVIGTSGYGEIISGPVKLCGQPSSTKGVTKDPFTPPSELAALYAAKSLLETGDVPNAQKDALQAYNKNTSLPSNIDDINKRIAELEAGPAGGQPTCKGICKIVKEAKEKAAEAEKNQPPAPEDTSTPTSTGTTAGNKAGTLSQKPQSAGSQGPAVPVAPPPPPVPVYNLPPLAQPGSYGGYNPPGAPLLGIPYSQLINPANNYSAPIGQQNTVPGSPYGNNYGYGTMQSVNNGGNPIFQMIGFSYGNQNPTSPQILSGDPTPVGQQSQQNGGTRIQGGYIFGGNGEL